MRVGISTSRSSICEPAQFNSSSSAVVPVPERRRFRGRWLNRSAHR